MSQKAKFIRRLKEAIYAWIGIVSVEELHQNLELSKRIEELMRSLSRLNA
jgi:hypothetical protein